MSAKELIAKNCEIALKETGAELIVMGCSGFSGLRGDLEKEFKSSNHRPRRSRSTHMPDFNPDEDSPEQS